MQRLPRLYLPGDGQTEKEALEYRMLEAGVKPHPTSNNFIVEYAFLEDPTRLSNNIGQVI